MLWIHNIYSISSHSLYNVNAIKALLADVSILSVFFGIVSVWLSLGLESDPYPCRYSQWARGWEAGYDGEGWAVEEALPVKWCQQFYPESSQRGWASMNEKERSWFTVETHFPADSPDVAGHTRWPEPDNTEYSYHISSILCCKWRTRRPWESMEP